MAGISIFKKKNPRGNIVHEKLLEKHLNCTLNNAASFFSGQPTHFSFEYSSDDDEIQFEFCNVFFQTESSFANNSLKFCWG